MTAAVTPAATRAAPRVQPVGAGIEGDDEQAERRQTATAAADGIHRELAAGRVTRSLDSTTASAAPINGAWSRAKVSQYRYVRSPRWRGGTTSNPPRHRAADGDHQHRSPR